MPERIQLSRKRGWRKPEGVRVVARPGRWGNPFRVENGDRAEAVRRFREFIAENQGMVAFDQYRHDTIRRELAGLDLACWCPLDEPCHADVLLAIANATSPSTDTDRSTK